MNMLQIDTDYDAGTYKIKWGANDWSQDFYLDFGSGDTLHGLELLLDDMLSQVPQVNEIGRAVDTKAHRRI